MSRFSLGVRRHWGIGAMLGGALLAACSVDTSDITFIRDEAFDEGGVGNGGVVGNAGVLNGGALNKAGSDGKAGSGGAATGGSKLTAGSDAGGSEPVGGTGGAGGSMAMDCPMVAGAADQTLLDNFEDGDAGLPMVGGRRGGWYLANDGTGMQMPMLGANMPPNPTTPGAMMTSYAMRTSGSGFTVWGASVGLVLLFGPPGRAPCPYDLSNYRGLRLFVRGTIADSVLRVQIPTVDTHQPAQGGTCMDSCGDHYGKEVMVTPSWGQVNVDFNQMTQQGHGREFPFDLSKALNIEFAVHPNGNFDFWIDQIEFY